MRRFLLVATMLATLILAGCQAAPAPPAPTATTQPSPTAAPTATKLPATSTPMPSPTAVPKTPTPLAAATRAPLAAPGSGQSIDGMDKLFAEALPTMMAEAIPTMMAEAVPTAMAEAMPTLMAILPTAPPAPTGNSVSLSQADLTGRWEGYITIDSVTLKGATAEEQKACDDQLKVIKGRQIPTAMDFSPQSATAGTVKVITEQDPQGAPQDEPLPYSYRSSTIVITADQGTDGTGTFEGKTIQTATGNAITGTWKSEGKVDPNAGASGGDGVISGTWVMRKPR